MISLPFRRNGSRNGTAAIEFALAAPMLVVLIAGVLELGFAIHKKMQVQYAAEAGALYAFEHGWDAAAIGAAVVNSAAGGGITASPAPSQFCGCPGAGGLSALACDATCPNGDPPGTYVRVNATATRQSILPYSTFSLPTALTGEATVRLQ